MGLGGTAPDGATRGTPHKFFSNRIAEEDFMASQEREPYYEGNGWNHRGSRFNAGNLGIKRCGTSNYRRKRQGCSYNSDHVRIWLPDSANPWRQNPGVVGPSARD